MNSNPFNWIKYYRIELIVILLAILHQVLQKGFHLKLGWVDNYGDDLLAVPFVSACILILENTFFYKNHQRKHSIGQLFIIFVFISVFFEIVGPKYSEQQTYDLEDVFYYFFGFLLSFILSFKFKNKKANP